MLLVYECPRFFQTICVGLSEGEIVTFKKWYIFLCCFLQLGIQLQFNKVAQHVILGSQGDEYVRKTLSWLERVLKGPVPSTIHLNNCVGDYSSKQYFVEGCFRLCRFD